MALRLPDGSEFLHIPKTGGTWVKKQLTDHDLISAKVGNMHSDYDLTLFGSRLGNRKQLLVETAKMLGGTFNEKVLKKKAEEKQPYRFCFVRDPYTWYESWWKYSERRDWRDFGKQNSALDWNPVSIFNGMHQLSFNDFLRKIIEVRPGFVSELYFSFTKPGISFIGKNENLENDFLYVMRRLGLEVAEEAVKSTGKVNVSHAESSQLEWDPDLRRAITQIELPALVHFDYISEEELDAYGISYPFTKHPSLAREER